MEAKYLGDYYVIKKIGQGSLGTVFLGEHRFMKKQYILKVLPEELVPDRAFVQRFEDGIKQLSQIDHPNIVKVHNVSYDQGVYFLVTDCIADATGETVNLAQFLSQEELKEEDIYHILYQIADALDSTHKKKAKSGYFIHGGLKLNNILVGPRTADGIKVYLSDFGLSRIIGSGTLLCRTYKVLADALGIQPVDENPATGEERYAKIKQDPYKLSYLQESFLQSYNMMAPEQKREMSRGSYSPKVDIYAFGVLAYYLLTKELPEGIFPWPSEVNQGLKKNWDLLVHSCLQKNADKRPFSLKEVLQQSLEDTRKLNRAPKVQTPVKEVSLEKPVFKEIAPIRYASQPVPGVPYASKPAPGVPLRGHQVLQSGTLINPATASHLSPAYAERRVKPKPSVPSPTMASSSRPPLPRGAQPAAAQSTRAAYAAGSALKEHEEHTNKILESSLSLSMKQAPTVTAYVPKIRRSKNIEPLLTDMVAISGGEYIRGSNNGSRDEMPIHTIFLDSFAVDTHPVTNEQFIRFVEYMGAEKDESNHDIIRLKESRIKRLSGKLVVESGYAKHPVIGVTWYGSIAYSKWIGKRLLTEAEWEIAALGGLAQEDYPTGDRIEKNHANFFGSDTTAVMSYPPNSYGIYDIVGNVYEWCQDWYAYNYYEISEQEPENPTGPIQGVYRVLRGGCWKSLDGDLRCAHRHRNKPGTVNRTYGFRCAANA